MEIPRCAHEVWPALSRPEDWRPSAETIAWVREVLFAPPAPPPDQADACLVLGSRNCAYRIQCAHDYGRQRSLCYVLTGGGPVGEGQTEAEFMRSYLLAQGVAAAAIRCDGTSTSTMENLLHARPLLRSIAPGDRAVDVVLVTGGFHLSRSLQLARRVFTGQPAVRVFALPAYGSHTHPDSWFLHATGRAVVGAELCKLRELDLFPVGPESPLRRRGTGG